MDNPPEHWDIAILGTGLSHSILAAALAQAGKRVLHLDENAYYGGDAASLALSELIQWAELRSSSNSDYDASNHPGSSQYMVRQRSRFTSVSYTFGDSPPDMDLRKMMLKESRQYSISLMPTIIPAMGDIISALVGSGVSRYGGFKLLEAVGVYDAGHIRRVPSSKEDVFKDRDMSLIEKRRLMKFLIFASGQFEQAPELQGQENTTFLDFLRTKFSLSATVSNAIVFAIAHCSSPSEHTLPALTRMRRYLHATGRYGNSPFLIGHYGGAGEVAQGFCRAAAVKGATYILGRAVESINHVAVVPPLPTSSEPVESVPIGPHFSIQLDGFANPVSADDIVTAPDYSGLLPPGSAGGAATSSSTFTATLTSASGSCDSEVFLSGCVAIVDRPVYAAPMLPPQHLEGQVDHSESDTLTPSITGPDTSFVVFPPGSIENGLDAPVFALVTGDGTLGCPTRKYIVYLATIASGTSPPSTNLPPNPTHTLGPYLQRLLAIRDPAPLPEESFSTSSESAVNQRSKTSKASSLFSLYYNQRLDHDRDYHSVSSQPPTNSPGNKVITLDESPSVVSPYSESADKAATRAETVFWDVVGGRPAQDEGDADLDPGAITTFWPLSGGDAKDTEDDPDQW
ncbi:Rab proteins geranylgeranyltransferase component A [Tulasnella sp. 332]|nr:Rab proteins geranylgeranyltransferase component A [Tulasnella sp. 332]